MIFRSKRKTFEKHIKPHLEHLYRLAYRLSGSKEDAEDLIQDLVVKLFSNPTDLSQLDNPKTWLSKVLYRSFVDNYRRQNRSPIISIVPEEDEFSESTLTALDDDQQNPETRTEHHRFIQLIDHSLKQMGEEYRVLIVMYEIEGYSLNEIQQILDTPIGTLKSRLYRARKKLRNLIEAGT
ncbi:MAG: RNA polymerase sigma factor, partial [Gammaproteobacteria bacterium]|nr:RNA polymerase sigma factor [Gammaproteobacteria bacterium]